MPDRPPAWLARWRPHLKLIAAIGSVVLAIGLLTLFLATQQRPPAESTAVPSTTVPPTVAATPISTVPASPAAVAWPPGSLPALLAMAPDPIGGDPGLPVQATYADISGWLDVRGIDAETLDDTAFREAVTPLVLPEPVRAGGVTDAWRDAYGFDLRQVDAVLAVGQAPNLVLVMPGRYDAEALYATWVANGYQAVAVEETTVWSLAPGDRIDLSAPASRPALGLLNTMVMLDDGTLIAAPRPSLMAGALRVIQGQARSLAAHDGLRAALPGSVDAVSAILATGELLAAPGSDKIPASPVPVEPLPDVDLVLFTMPSTGAPVRMTLVLERATDAPAALRRALRDRVAADPAWSARWHVDDIRITGEGRLVEVTISSATEQASGLGIANPREMEPFRWITFD